MDRKHVAGLLRFDAKRADIYRQFYFISSIFISFVFIFTYKFKHVESFGMAHNRHTTETNLCKNNIWFLISEAERWKRNIRRIVTN